MLNRQNFLHVVPFLLMLILLSALCIAKEPALHRAVQKASYATSWHCVDSLSTLGLTQSARDTVATIFLKAKAAANNDQMVKALMYEFRLVSVKEEDAFFKVVARIREELRTAPFPLAPLLHSMLAECYHHYYENNRWRFLNRSQPVNGDTSAIDTWDLRTIMEQTTQQYQLSLNESAQLKRQTFSGFTAVVVTNGADSARRPTLYDFLAHRAVDFFSMDDNELTKPANEFTLTAADYFLPYKKFIKLPLLTPDSTSLKFQALLLLQELTAFHAGDACPDALIAVDLERLAFVRERSVLPEKDSLYMYALENLAKQFRKSPESASVTYALAELKQGWAATYKPHQDERYRWLSREVLALCKSAVATFPESYGAAQCQALGERITEKSLGFTAEEVALPNVPFTVLLSYKNISHVYWRQVAISLEEYEKSVTAGFPDSVTDRLFRLKPVAAWSEQVPAPDDYQEHQLESKVPAVAPGFYVLLAASDSSFSIKRQAVSWRALQVSGISYIHRQNRDGGEEVYLCDRQCGAPLSGVTVKAWLQHYDSRDREYTKVLHGTYRSDALGHVTIPSGARSSNDNSCSIECQLGNDRLIAKQQFYLYPSAQAERTQEYKTIFFTDRALYRPGQTVYFKGIMLRTNEEKSTIVAGEKTNIIFSNDHGQELFRQKLVTNSYGSLHGSFTIPLHGLSGAMTIANEHGSVGILVEEYKRPKFTVTITPPDGALYPDELIHVTGTAKAYTGAPVDGAVATYRVVRTARFPIWWWCWRPSRWQGERGIAQGTVATNDTGGFSIDFKAVADRSIPRKENPVFTYRVTVDVTDMTGETRSASGNIDVGYSAVTLAVDVERQVQQQRELHLPVTTENCNGQFYPASGSIAIYALSAPQRIVRPRLWEQPDTASMSKKQYLKLFPEDMFDDDENAITTWPTKKCVFQGTFNTQKEKTVTIPGVDTWNVGAYRVEALTNDTKGFEVRDVRYFTLYAAQGTKIPYPQPDWFVPVKNAGEPGDTALFLVGSSYKDATIYYEIEHKGEITKRAWLPLANEQKRLTIPILESYRGNVALRVTFIHSNRSYTHTETVAVPWTNKNLTLSFATFRDKLLPGEKEQWKIKIAGAERDKVAAEMVATLYDASLDAFTPHDWTYSLYPTYVPYRFWNSAPVGQVQRATVRAVDWNTYHSVQSRTNPYLNWFGYAFESYPGGIGYGRGSGGGFSGRKKSLAMPSAAGVFAIRAVGSLKAEDAPDDQPVAPRALQKAKGVDGAFTSALSATNKENKLDLSKSSVRHNLNETAFFFPTLETDKNGEILVSFTMPEALTQWKMLGFAHTKSLQYGMVSHELVTRKELMVVPNPPRFFREHDRLTFTAKVTNLSDTILTGKAQLMLCNAATMQPLDSLFNNNRPEIPFIVPKGKSTPLAWDITIPEGIAAVSVKVVAQANQFTDGEEQVVPVLTNSILVTESVPLEIRNKGSKQFHLPTLVSGNGGSKTVRNHQLTLEFTANPAWYAIQALPYLMEYPYECAEQTFARYYANSIAAKITKAAPRIKAVFDLWRTQTPDALLSALEKNQELKSLMLEETPWVFDAQNESERKKRVALLFDLNRLAFEQKLSLDKLQTMQLDNGGFPWFAGGADDRYISHYIAIGMGRLDHLGCIALRKDADLWSMMQRCVQYSDNRLREEYDRLKKTGHAGEGSCSEEAIQYLYMRSFYRDIPQEKNNKIALDYFIMQAKKHWLQNQRSLQGMLALALHRGGDTAVSAAIVRSMRENALTSEDLGMYWKDMYEGGNWWWYQAPVESQALMVELFDEVAHDTAAVEACKTWLLKSKQTQNWPTTRATADACYALLLRGTDWLTQPSTVLVTLGETTMHVTDAKGSEPGTGYFKQSWRGNQIKPAMGNITVTKKERGVAWGALYWQYFEQLDKINQHATPLNLQKALFLQVESAAKITLIPVTAATVLKPGDNITVRIELRLDRAMEYLHLKDMRASGFEPRNVLSGYRYQDGLAYYESTRDAATNFFFNYLNKGTYVFEYPLVVTHAGDFSNGIATIQSMYAPEFTSHAAGARVVVGKRKE